MTDNETEQTTDIDDTADELTEQIDASFGPMNVYVSGTDQEEVLESFNDVWEKMLETSDIMHERKQDMDDEDDGAGPSRTFG